MNTGTITFAPAYTSDFARLPLTYLASPYTHTDPAIREWRAWQAELAAAKLMREGQAVFSPIAHSHAIARHLDNAVDGAFWQIQDEPYLRMCSRMVVLMLPGWEQSKGCAYEINVALQRGIPLEYIDP